MVNHRVPVKVSMQQRTQVEAVPLPGVPRFEPRAVKGQQCGAFAPELLFVVLQQVSESFSDLKARLEAHRSFRQGANQRLERHFRVVSSLVAVVIRIDPAKFVTGNKGPRRSDDYVVQNVPYG